MRNVNGEYSIPIANVISPNDLEYFDALPSKLKQAIRNANFPLKCENYYNYINKWKDKYPIDKIVENIISRIDENVGIWDNEKRLDR
jgi:hypothetical protein